MIRRIGAALIGLALILPAVAAPVAGHGGGFSAEVFEQADDEIVGWVVNHTSSRRSNVQVTVTWENGTNDIVEIHPVFVTNMAPHSASPFKVTPTADVSGLAMTGINAVGVITGTKPTGGLHVNGCTFTGDVCNGTITNDAAGPATDVRVYATRGTGVAATDAAASANIPTIAAGATVPYAIAFEAGSTGNAVNLIAKTNSGPFYTSWNNYFGDLSATSVDFVGDIAFLADEGITLGCGAAIFCPKDNVSRASMAVFLDRAITFAVEDAPDQGFTDLTGLSAEAIQSINDLAANGVTGGCSVTPKMFCPNQAVTRGQMSKFIVTAYDLTVVQTDAFPDDDGHFSEDYNDTMSFNGITSGCSNSTNRFCPNSNVLREQMAVFIHKAELLP